MGACNSQLTPEEKEQYRVEKIKSKEIEDTAEKDHMSEAKINKLLLLGAGQSGKSTLFKQVIRIYGSGFSKEDRAQYEPVIFANIITSMQELLVQADQRSLAVSADAAPAREFVRGCKPDTDIDEALAAHVATLWKEPAVRDVFAKRAEFQLNDNMDYFFDNIARIGSPDFSPNDTDLLRARVRTTGIIEYEFTYDKNRFRMFDVGGQRNERKKWIHCFENVTAVIFVASVADYDQVLYEDNTTNRLHEALNLFEEVCNSKWFKETSMILFLNKSDLFREKIGSVPLKNCLAGYNGNNSYDDALAYIKEEFELRNTSDKEVYVYVTCAMDKDNVAKVFSAVKDIVIKKSLDEAGLR